jgi:two-component system chemotaxis response regulator CheY
MNPFIPAVDMKPTGSSEKADAPSRRAVGEEDEAKLGALKVLIVDDDENSRRALERAVVLLGHTCRSARDGQEAWEMHQAEHADVILSDWGMPGIDGLELCRRTRVAEGDGPYTYFIFVSAFDDREHFLQGMNAGADDYQAKPIDFDELRARFISASRVIALHRKLAEKATALRRDSQASFRMARLDVLTGVGNRLAMNEDLDVLWARAKRYGHRHCAAFCDIDWFKAYNDHYGHLAGDIVLQRVAAAARRALREADGFYRYGGEEFLVILPEQSLAEASVALNRVRAEVEALAIPTITDFGVVTISAGLAALDLPIDEDVESWLGRADRALYLAKRGGRNRVDIATVLAP